ncbi:MAG: type II secretion system protein [Clostridia bacterium]|nr:type II secretion system protein [Clostridia bacterium]
MLFKVMNRMKSDNRGFTIAELMVTLVIMGLVAALIVLVASNIWKRYKLVEDRYIVQTEIKAIADAFSVDASTGALSTATKVDMFYEDPNTLLSSHKFNSCEELGTFIVHDTEWTSTDTSGNSVTYAAHSIEFPARNPASTSFDESSFQYTYLFVYDGFFYVLNGKQYVAYRFPILQPDDSYVRDEVNVKIDYDVAIDAFMQTQDANGKWEEGSVYNKETTKGHEYLPDGITITISSGDNYDFKYSLMCSFALKNYNSKMSVNKNSEDGSDYITNEYIAGYSKGTLSNYPDSDALSKLTGTATHLSDSANVIKFIALKAFNSGEIAGNSGATSTGFGCATSFLMVGSDIGEGVKSTLRDFRDNTLRGNAVGDLIIEKYYDWSPAIIDYAAQHDGARNALKKVVTDIAYLIEMGK